jgi:hypothetical protein
MKALGGEKYSSYSFTTSALDGGEWSASRSGRAFTPGERIPGTHCTGGWVGPRAGLDTEIRGKILCPCRGSNLDHPVVQSVARHYTDWATPAPTSIYKLLKIHFNIISAHKIMSPKLPFNIIIFSKEYKNVRLLDIKYLHSVTTISCAKYYPQNFCS